VELGWEEATPLKCRTILVLALAAVVALRPELEIVIF